MSVVEILSGGGEMGALARQVDWCQTPVGPAGQWPQSLRTALSILLESKFPMLLCWGPDYVQFYNDPFRPILGQNKHPALGKSTRETFMEAWHIIGPLFEQVMQGTAVGFEDMLVPLDRNGFLEECYFVYSYSPIRDESGGVGGVLVTCTETTGRVLAERRLNTLRELASQAAQPQTVDAAWAGAARVLATSRADLPFSFIYELDEDGSAARIVEPSSAEWVPRLIAPADTGTWPLFDAAAAGSEQVVDDLRRRFGDQAGPIWPEPVARAVVLPITHPGRSGPYGFLVAGLSPRLALDARYRDFLSLVADQIATAIANARAYAEERRRTEALLELDRQKTAFFSNVSHEFRTPLTLLLGPLEDALSRSPRSLDGSDLVLVHRNALRLLRLVNTLLDFSRIEAGRSQAALEETDLAALTREVASAFQSLIEQAGLTFEIDCPPLASRVLVDPGMWEKVLLNLLSNAFKFTLQGGIRVQLRQREDAVELIVRDTGAGIPAGELPHVFDRFHRVDGTPARTFEGSGIGLALVRELVRLHRGTVDVQSVTGEGSSFIVTIPVSAAPASVEPRALNTPRHSALPYLVEASQWGSTGGAPVAVPADAATVGPPAGSARARILVVDDNADMREYVHRLLGATWIVDVATNGRDALERIAANPPDLVVSDVMMPEMDGMELLRRLRATPETRSLPLILLSARSGEESAVEGLTAGADDYVVKPFSARELVARAHTQLEVSRLRRESEAQHKAAESANRAKDEFLAMLGHELRNPLAPILTALQLMTLRGDVGAEKERAVIERQVRHVVRLVDDLLDVSRIARGKIELKREHVELATIVAKAVEVTSPLIEQKHHSLEVDVPQEGLAVDGDPTRLQQILFNLLNNAAKYTEPRGRIAIAASRIGEAIELRVRDSGIGIEPEMLPNIFELFVQERQALDRSQGGLGLGLAIVRNLVELHGGRVSASSGGRGQGSEFIVTLPASSAPVSVPPPSPPMQRSTSAGARRVLVVDDNEDAANFLAAALRIAGFETRTAADGPAAIRTADEFAPHVALLDLGLPVMDGYELADHLRHAASAPILIAVSGYGSRGDQERSEASGFATHLVKPVDIDEVITRLRALRV